MLLAPPTPRVGAREVRKHAASRPHLADVIRAIGQPDERVASESLAIHAVGAVHFHAGIHDRHHAQTLLRQRVEERLGTRKLRGAPGEDAIAVHEVNVEMDDVRGDAPAPELAGEVGHLGVGVIAVAALVVTERPPGGQWRAAGEAAVACQHAVQPRSAHHVVPQLTAVDAALGGVRHSAFHPRAEVHLRLERIVVQHAVRDAVAHGGVEGEGAVDGGLAHLNAAIRVPEREHGAFAIHCGWLLACAEVARARLVTQHVHHAPGPLSGAQRLSQQLAIGGGVAHDHTHGMPSQPGDHSLRRHHDGVTLLAHRCGSDRRRAVVRGERSGHRKVTRHAREAHAHAKADVPHRLHHHARLCGTHDHSARYAFVACRGPERREAGPLAERLEW